MTLWNQTAAQLLEATSSHQPTPGGGSVAAISAAFGVGLLQMALEVTRRKRQKVGGDLSEDAQQTLRSLGLLSRRLQALADEDVTVFERYMAALKLPKADEGQKQTRKKALEQASAAARQTPYEVALLSVQALTEAASVRTEIDKGIISDLGAGAALLRGAADAALLTLDINLAGLSAAERLDWVRQRQQLAQAAQQQAQALLDEIHAALVEKP